jgi:hypothetical protein
MHYAVYLDEFGHIGPYVSNIHRKYNDSPVFGLAGMLLPVEQVREFAIWFYQIKCKLLAWDLQHDNPAKRPAYQWEKKGSQIYTVRNVNKYQELRRATNRILYKIKQANGHVFYTGVHKIAAPDEHDSSKLFSQQLLQTIRKIDQFCVAGNATFMVLLDEQQAGDVWRMRNVEACTLAMFEDKIKNVAPWLSRHYRAKVIFFKRCNARIGCVDWSGA